MRSLFSYACYNAVFNPANGRLDIGELNIKGTGRSYGAQMIKVPGGGYVFQLTKVVK